MDDYGSARAVVWVHGRVQGVGFRWWARARALELGLVGHARNASGGRVEVLVQGPREKVQQMLDLLDERPSRHLRPGEVQTCVTTWGPPREGLSGFDER